MKTSGRNRRSPSYTAVQLTLHSYELLSVNRGWLLSTLYFISWQFDESIREEELVDMRHPNALQQFLRDGISHRFMPTRITW